MPVLLAKAASMSSSAFFSEAAAKTVMVLSCASAGVGGLASAMPSTVTVRNAVMRSGILALLAAAGAPARYRAALRHVVRPQVCQEATNPEAPFRGSGALTARHAPQRKSSSIAGEGKGGAWLSLPGPATPSARPPHKRMSAKLEHLHLSWMHNRAAHSVCSPSPLVGRGWGWGSVSGSPYDPHPGASR